MNFEEYVCFKCNHCEDEGNLVNKDWINDEDYNTCWKCNKKYQVIPIEEINNLELFIELIDSQLESENYHDRIGLADDIWGIIEVYIPMNKRIEVIKKIGNQILNT